MSFRTPEFPVSRKRDVETFIDEWLVEYDVPGLSVAVFDADEMLYADGLGARCIETRDPASADTLYSVASVTKIFTATAVLQLVERGEIELDDEISDYVDVWVDVPGEPITVRDLLSHSSGMPNDYGGQREPLFSGSTPTSPLVTDDDRTRHANGAADRRIIDPPGYLYSNRGYGILGDIVETVVGSHADYVEREIFAPLDMDRSQVGYGKLSEADDDVMTGYVIEDGEPVVNDHDLKALMDPPFAAGGVLSSVTELATMIRCLMNDGTLGGEQVLSSESVEAMFSRQATAWTTIDGQKRGYGYGLRLADFDGDTLVGHTGTSPVSRAYAGMLRDRGVGVALGANTARLPIEPLARGVLAVVTGAPPETVVPHLSLKKKTAAVTGTYEGYRGGMTVSVEAADDEFATHIEVTYQDGPGWTFPAFPESTRHDEYRFYAVRNDGVREPVTFHRTDAGMELRCNVDSLRRTEI